MCSLRLVEYLLCPHTQKAVHNRCLIGVSLQSNIASLASILIIETGPSNIRITLTRKQNIKIEKKKRKLKFLPKRVVAFCFFYRCSINDADLCAHHTNTSSFVHRKSMMHQTFGTNLVGMDSKSTSEQ